MLETIRAYALERLEDSGEMESAASSSMPQYFGDVIVNQVAMPIVLREGPHTG